MEAMDEILVMDKGMIVERGNHMELLNNREEYYKMWSLRREYVSGI